MSRNDIQHLEALTELAPHLVSDYLHDPHWTAWGNLSLADFSAGFDRLVSKVWPLPHVKDLLILHIMTEYLLRPEERPPWLRDWLREHLPTERYFAKWRLENLTDGQWLAQPVVMAPLEGMTAARIRYFIVGLMPFRNAAGAADRLWPSWADPLLGMTLKQTIRNAVAAVSNLFSPPEDRTFICYPLVMNSPTLCLDGASLGLPMALGLIQLLTGVRAPCRCLSTGALDLRGQVLPVGRLTQKMAGAAGYACDLFLYPAANSAKQVPDNLEMLPISHLEDAWMAVSLHAAVHAPGHGGSLKVLSEMLKAPDTFIHHIRTVDPAWVRRAAEHGRTTAIARRIVQSPRLFQQLSEKLAECLNNGELEIAAVLSQTIQSQMSPASPPLLPELAMFKWCSLNLALANHRGDIAAAEGWIHQGERLASVARQSDLTALTDFYNHQLIHRHNRFEFSPHWPRALQEALPLLESRYQQQCRFGCTTDQTLGRLYGSIVQNYAFCGPAYLSLTLEYHQRARKALGEGAAEDLSDGWRRQLNYLTYAFLDAKAFDRAERSFLDYMGIASRKDLGTLRFCQRSSWEHALAARFLADAGHPAEQRHYLTICRSLSSPPLNASHPRQLWAFNMGRMAFRLDDAEAARRFWLHSLELCLDKSSGSTIGIMALLPLSALHQINVLTAVQMRHYRQTLRKTASRLHPAYFRFLHEQPFSDILAAVWNRPDTIFPFTYR